MNRCSILLPLTIALAVASPAAASERSEVLYTYGLVEFHQQRYEEALRYFEDAVEADGRDPYALYYRGVTRGRLGKLDGAIADLRSVRNLMAEGDLYDRATLELGVALIRDGQHDDAVQILYEVQPVLAVGTEATLFAGVAHLHAGRLAVARQELLRVHEKLDDDDAKPVTPRDDDAHLRVVASYHLGEVEYAAGNWSEAVRHFQAVVGADAASPTGRRAAEYLRQITAAAPRRYEVHALVGFDYDSNVALAPSDDVVKDVAGISDQSDGRAVIGAGGVYEVWRNGTARLLVGYDFFQSLHFDLTEFDLQDHRPALQIRYDAGWARFGLLGRYDYYLLEDESFLHQGTVAPWVVVPYGDVGRTEIFYRMKRRDFRMNRLSRLRDGWEHEPGARQYFYLGSPHAYALAGYRYGREDTIHDAGDAFSYDGHQVEGGAGWDLSREAWGSAWWTFAAEAVYAYRHERYDGASGGRRDNEHEVLVTLRKPLFDRLDLLAAYRGTINNSNDERFEYDRHVGSVALEVRF